jgi:hypothetical protein
MSGDRSVPHQNRSVDLQGQPPTSTPRWKLRRGRGIWRSLLMGTKSECLVELDRFRDLVSRGVETLR